MPTYQDNKGRIIVRVYGAPVKINERVRSWQLQEGEIAASKGWDYTIGGRKRIRHGVQSFWCPPSGRSIYGAVYVSDAPTSEMSFPWTPEPLGGDRTSRSGILAMGYYGLWRVRPTGFVDSITWSTWSPNNTSWLLKAGMSLGNISPGVPGTPWAIQPTLAACPTQPHPSGASLTAPLVVVWNVWDVNPAVGSLWTRFDGRYYDDGENHSWFTDIYKPTAMEITGGRLWIANDQAINELPSGATAIGIDWGIDMVNWKSGSDLRYSDLYEFAHAGTGGPELLSTFGPILYIEPGLGGSITAIKAIRSESPALVVFKESAICLFQPRWGTDSGYISTSVDDIDTTESRITVLNAQVGCTAPKTIVEIPGSSGTDFIFLSQDGHLRKLSRVATDAISGAGGTLTFDSPALVDRISIDGLHRCSAVLWDNKYILTLPLDDAWYPSHIATFDADTLALRSVEPFTNQDLLNVTRWASGRVKPQLFAAKLANWSAPNTPIGPTGNMTTDTTPTGATVGYHLFSIFDSSSTRDPDDMDIEAEEDTQGFTFGFEDRKKRFNYFAAMMEPCTIHTGCLEVQYSVDGSNFSHLATLTIPQATTSVKPTKKKADLTAIAPDYFIQFRLKAKGDSRFSIAYIECAAKLIEEEFDNEIT